MLTLLSIAVLFAYHPPTDDTQPRHDAVRAAEKSAGSDIENALKDIENIGDRSAYGCITATTKQFAETIVNKAPPSIHRDLAVVAVGLARNAANEAVTDIAGRGRLLALARTKLQEARWLACTAIACGNALDFTNPAPSEA